MWYASKVFRDIRVIIFLFLFFTKKLICFFCVNILFLYFLCYNFMENDSFKFLQCWGFTLRNGPTRAPWRVSSLHLCLLQQPLKLMGWVGTVHQSKTLNDLLLLLELHLRCPQHPHRRRMRSHHLCSWMRHHHHPNSHLPRHHVLLVGLRNCLQYSVFKSNKYKCCVQNLNYDRFLICVYSEDMTW